MAKKINTIEIAKPIITPAIIKKLNQVLTSRRWVQGEFVEALEKEFAIIARTKYAIVVSSGTAALHTLLASIQFQKDDEVITTPMTFAATTNAILLSGAKPVFADISEEDFNIDPKEVEKKITKKTKAIMTVDLYGQTANYKLLTQIAKKHNIFLLSDSSQAIGALHHNKPIGFYTDAATFSLYATKNVAAGEGGVIVTNNPEIAAFARSFRNQGLVNGIPETVGLNYRLTDILAVIGLEQIKMINKISKKRQELSAFYTASLKDVNEIILPKVSGRNEHVFHQYTVRIKGGGFISRDKVKAILANKNITTGIHYQYPLHLVKQTAVLEYKKGDFPIAEKACEEVLSLPMHFYLTQKEQQVVIKAIKEIFA